VPTVTEPDRFIPHIPLTLPKGAVNTTAADWQKVRACFVAAGFDWSIADKVMRRLEAAGGVWALSAAAATTVITSASVANPTVVTTAAPHGLRAGDAVTIAGMAGGTPSLNGAQTVLAVTSPTTFLVNVNVTVQGTGGTVTVPTDTGRRYLARGLALVGKQSSRAKYVDLAFATLAAATPIRWTTKPTVPISA
jgi:hypothetical protein